MSATATEAKSLRVNTGKGPRFAVIQFPGSNCDQDAYHVVKGVIGRPVDYVWHRDRDLKGYDVVILPGGFSYGDYLRTGAIARFAPIMDAIRAHAESGRPVIGICNGFQVLCEAHLLPGALVRNESCRFACKYVHLRLESTTSPFTRAYWQGQIARLPIAHGEGRYICDDATLSELESSGRVLFRYVDASGEPTAESNPNGSIANIAGISNAAGNVVGMMPHPERASEKILGSADGRAVFESVVQALA